MLDEDVVEEDELVEVVDGDAAGAGAGAAAEVGAFCVTGGTLVVKRTVNWLLEVTTAGPGVKENDVGVRGDTVTIVRGFKTANKRQPDL